MKKDNIDTRIDELEPAEETQTVSGEDGVEDEVFEPMPDAIASFCGKMLLVAVLFVLVAIGSAVIMKNLSPLFFFVPACYFFYRYINISYRYRRGRIRTVAVLCTSVKPSRITDSCTVTFRTEPDDGSEQEYFRFANIPKRTSDQFVELHPYIIYYDIDDPHTLIGSTDI